MSELSIQPGIRWQRWANYSFSLNIFLYSFLMPSAGTATFIKTAFFFSRVWRIFLWLVGQQRLICLELEAPQDLSPGVECPSGTCELLTSTNVPVHYYTITVMKSWTVPELLCTRAPSVLPMWHLLCSGHEFAAMIRTLGLFLPLVGLLEVSLFLYLLMVHEEVWSSWCYHF